MKRMTIYLILLLVSCLKLHANPRALELKQQVASILPSLDGWCSREKALEFIDLVLETKPDLCVEIGVFAGASLFPVASALKHNGSGIIVGIDAWDKMECIKHFDPQQDRAHLVWWSNLDLNRIYQSYLNMLKRFQLEGYVHTIVATSEKAASSLVEPIDILYLDGSHNRNVCCQDVKLYLPKVKSGGYIWLNDSLWEEMQDAIDLLLEECQVIKIIDNGNCLLFKKK